VKPRNNKKEYEFCWSSLLLVFIIVFNFASFRIGYTRAAWTATAEVEGNSVTTGTWVPTTFGVVLNEFLPNPDGNEYGYNFGTDSDSMPKGEWVELYNNGDTSVDLTGWYIRDDSDSSDHKIMIDQAHTGLITPVIASHSFMVVYMNKELLDNSVGDSVRLFNNNDVLVDSYIYTLPADYCNLKPTEGETNDETGNGVGKGCTSSVAGNKSYARIPDGVGEWVDPIPTPGIPNELELETEELVTAPVSEVVEETVEVEKLEVVVTSDEGETVDGEQNVPDEEVNTLEDETDLASTEINSENGEEDLSSEETNSEEDEADPSDTGTDTGDNGDVKVENPAPTPEPLAPAEPTPPSDPSSSETSPTE